ncbi:Thioredoxin-like fold protein [Ophiocordyceps camponoti-floridani]|uniref:Thioredoxin-like fold protein n=1 Tax=Ophiocordyceps camponoti-floridani TaxID=2030778 RepID=A0A8H4Q5P7_9HYPO|nr:Thioredoxin-like fold protein [Ophiocordyceps camponoti-floridani]
MLSSLTTKIALRKVGIKSDSFDFISGGSSSEPKKPTDDHDVDGDDDTNGGWPAWMSIKALPMTVHPWLAPTPPPIAVARLPSVGDVAPRDRDRKLELGGGRRVLIVFLRCVGCAFAQKTFLNLRTLANRHSQSLTCIAVSHSSPQATRKWIDLLGGAWNVRVVIDEDRAIYAAWGLGLSTYWSLFNPTTQLQGWREKGWLGDRVADAVQRRRGREYTESPALTSKDRTNPDALTRKKSLSSKDRNNGKQQAALASQPPVPNPADDPTNVLGNKWQEAGAFAIDGRGTVVWAVKAQTADDVMDLDEGVRLLSL